MLASIPIFLLSIVEAVKETQTKQIKSLLLTKYNCRPWVKSIHCCQCSFKSVLTHIYASFLTGGVDEMTKDSKGAHPASFITVLQLLKNKHDQPVWEGVSYREKEIKLGMCQ